MEQQIFLIDNRFCVKDELGRCIPIQFPFLGGVGKGRPGSPGPQGPQGASGAFPYGNDIGVVDAYKVTGLGVTKTPGQTFEIKINNSNIGASTIEVDGYGALPFVDTDLNPLQPDDIEADSVYLVTYNANAGGIGIEGWQLLGLAKPFANINPLTNVLFVDKNAAIGTPDGSIANPYKTIMDAINSIPTPPIGVPPNPDLRKTWNIVISPDTYDEELTIDITRKRVVLTSWGTWNLGKFDASNWLPSGTRRNITIIGNTTSTESIRCGLTITSFNQVGQRYSTNQSYIEGCRISGAVIVKVSGSGSIPPVGQASVELDLQAEVFGTTGASDGNSFYIDGGNGNSNPILQVYFYNGRFHGKVNLLPVLPNSNTNFQHAENVRFGGLLSCQNYSLIKSCRFDAVSIVGVPTGMTVNTASNAGLFPEGIIDTYFAPAGLLGAPTFTGPAASLRLNGNTNYWIKTNSTILAGGVTKVIQDDLVP